MNNRPAEVAKAIEWLNKTTQGGIPVPVDAQTMVGFMEASKSLLAYIETLEAANGWRERLASEREVQHKTTWAMAMMAAKGKCQDQQERRPETCIWEQKTYAYLEKFFSELPPPPLHREDKLEAEYAARLKLLKVQYRTLKRAGNMLAANVVGKEIRRVESFLVEQRIKREQGIPTPPSPATPREE